MGCVENISYDKYPEQCIGNNDFEYGVNSEVKVIYNYDASKFHIGVIIRDDKEAPYETIIKTDNGRIIRGTECQFSFTGNIRKVD